MNFNLLLIRHAKSSWKDIKLVDFDRPLNKRGMHNAPLMANRIRTYSLDLSLIISSPAKRAMNTTNTKINNTILKNIATAIRSLSIDAIEKAGCGHPGLPLGCAEIGAYLYAKGFF